MRRVNATLSFILSFSEDYELVENIKSDTEKVRIFTGIRSAAETGWDFSSRHVRDPNTPNNSKYRRVKVDAFFTRENLYSILTFGNCTSKLYFQSNPPNVLKYLSHPWRGCHRKLLL